MKFLAKFFQVAEKVTTLMLLCENQQFWEDLIDYIKRFQDKAVDYHEPVDQAYVVRAFVDGTLRVFKKYMVNLNVSTFMQLLEAKRNLR